MKKIKITIQADDKKVSEEIEVETKDFKNRLNRLFRKLKKKL